MLCDQRSDCDSVRGVYDIFGKGSQQPVAQNVDLTADVKYLTFMLK